MDSDDDSETRTCKGSWPVLILRCSLALLFPILSFFVFSFFVGLVAVFLANSSASSPISVPSQCKIVSSSVDLRSSKVCELGLFNYKAKRVFYPFGKSKFRCRYDYYWASVFKVVGLYPLSMHVLFQHVEYMDLSSGVTQSALAEAPNEALPLNCRPNFGAAWLNKDKFKVNETYDCWYTYGIPKVSLRHDGFFSCQAKDPSTFEMIKRYSILYLLFFLELPFDMSLRMYIWATALRLIGEDAAVLACKPGKIEVLEMGYVGWSCCWFLYLLNLNHPRYAAATTEVFTILCSKIDSTGFSWSPLHPHVLPCCILICYGLVGCPVWEKDWPL
ncbi:hypothetical protein TIFTF001_009978 [Ficus carica]|uniref:Uncharacterized protein n=1 Tax=Ficus carica TaxID=3494 RepID=A0AA88D426_FICCA|nr:hypothetical protein TIFTF001_009978 [Ficus carica]